MIATQANKNKACGKSKQLYTPISTTSGPFHNLMSIGNIKKEDKERKKGKGR